jgi:hypothetical protein
MIFLKKRADPKVYRADPLGGDGIISFKVIEVAGVSTVLFNFSFHFLYTFPRFTLFVFVVVIVGSMVIVWV